MSIIETLRQAIVFNRTRTLGILEKVEKESDPQKVLGYRPGSGRAHIGWQLMHIGITEELFATERLVPGTKADYAELVPRFKGGSTPDDNIPSSAQIREVLEHSRRHLLATLERFTDDQLGNIPDAFKDRGLTLHDVLHIIAWHEPHHQGQAHITLNLWKASQG